MIITVCVRACPSGLDGKIKSYAPQQNPQAKYTNKANIIAFYLIGESNWLLQIRFPSIFS